MADFAAASATTESGAAPLTAKASTSKKVGKPRKPAQPADHPKYKEMITSAISSLKERRGSSRQAILKYVLAHYKVGGEVTKVNSRIKMALRAGIKNGNLRQVKGSGASGSFRLGQKVPSIKPRITKKPKTPAKKPAVKKSKTVAGKKKVAAPKKAAVKKPNRQAASKKLKKSPKKVARKPVKGKSPAKKAAKPKKVVRKTPSKKTSKPKMSRK